jgi:hypothetical protein
MSLSKLSLAGNNLIIPAGDGQIVNLFLRCRKLLRPASNPLSLAHMALYYSHTVLVVLVYGLLSRVAEISFLGVDRTRISLFRCLGGQQRRPGANYLNFGKVVVAFWSTLSSLYHRKKYFKISASKIYVIS